MTTLPTITQLYDDCLAQLQTKLGVTVPLFGKNFLRALAGVQAALLWLLYQVVGDVQKNIFVDTAYSEAAGGTLERFGRVKIGRNPYPATQGQYTATVTGIAGSSIEANTTFISDDDSQSPGLLFILDNSYTMPGVSGTITLRALTAGSGARLLPGDTLTATAPIIGVNAGATVLSETVTPTDAEDIEDYRNVVLLSYRIYPQGGAPADYRLWGLEVSGVKQIYPYAASGAANEINVFVEATTTASTDGKGTPSSAMLSDVYDSIQSDPATGRGRRPLGVFAVNCLPVVINTIQITINDSSIATSDQATITAALQAAVAGIRPFIAGADILSNKNDTLSNNIIINIILNAVPGSIFTSVTMLVQVGGGPATPETVKSFDNGNIPYLSTVTYA